MNAGSVQMRMKHLTGTGRERYTLNGGKGNAGVQGAGLPAVRAGQMEERRIEGLWDCVYCGQKAIRARFDTCMSCGKPRGIENVFYLPEDLDAAVLTQEEKAKTTNAPDWLCEYCGSYNRADVSCCVKCGGDRAESKVDYGMLHKLTGRLFGRRD